MFADGGYDRTIYHRSVVKSGESRKMNLVFAIYSYFPYGGLQKDFYRMMEEALKRGHFLTVLAAEWEGEKPEGMVLKLLKAKGLTNHSRMASFGKEVRKTVKEMRKGGEKVTLVAFNRFGGADFYFAADNCLAERSARKHSKLNLSLNPRYRTMLKLEKEVLAPKAKTKILYIVETQKKEYQKIYQTPDERFYYLPPGIDRACKLPEDHLSAREKKRNEVLIDPELCLIVLVGANLLCKGADRLIEAFAALPQKIQRKCRIFLAGSVTEKKCRLLAEKLKITDRVIFGGARKDVPELLLAADLMVHPAREEATGTVLVEALAMGLPVACSGTCGFASYVRESGNIVLPEPFSPQDLSAALITLLADPSTLRKMRKRTMAYSKTADFYSRAEIAVDILEKESI